MNVAVADFFTELPDVNIYGSVSHDNIISPDFSQNFVAFKYFSRFGSQQRYQLKFFFGQSFVYIIYRDLKLFKINLQISKFGYFIFFLSGHIDLPPQQCIDSWL